MDSLGFVFQVTVTDGHNPMQTRQITVTVATPSYANDVQAIWTAKCVSCHDGMHANVPMDLSAGSSRGALVGQDMVASCANTKRVVASDPTHSGLINKLTGSTCGTRMPENAPALSAGELVMIQSWILRGALDN